MDKAKLEDQVQKLIDRAGDSGRVSSNTTMNEVEGMLYEKRSIDGKPKHGKPYTVFVPYDAGHRSASAIYSEISGYWFFGK